MPESEKHRLRRGRFSTIFAVIGAGLSGRLRIYEIAEHSMRPTLQDGDWIAATTRTGSIRAGDVVVLEHPDRLGFELVKRVSSIGADGVTLLGDDPSAGSVDSRHFGPVPPNAIVARVLLRYRPLPPSLIR